MSMDVRKERQKDGKLTGCGAVLVAKMRGNVAHDESCA
jgi:hypothetical protein